MKISRLIEKLNIKKVSGNTDIEISDIIYDSRKVVKNCMFVCLPGKTHDGHEYISDAINSGASAIVTQKNIDVSSNDIAIIQVEDTRKFLAESSAIFFDNPASKLTTIGITGTKGKTTCSFMIRSILESAGYKCGIIGTIGAIYNNKIFKLNNTTPESYEAQKHMSAMLKEGCKYVVIEASSIGLRDKRLDGFDFDVGAFTNFSHDHIGQNEHADMEEYLYCKSILFKKCKIGIINSDDKNYSSIISGHTCQIYKFGENSQADYRMENVELIKDNGKIGVKLDIKGKINLENVQIPVPGQFNAYNALLAAAVCDVLGINEKNIISGLKTATTKGRVEKLDIGKDYSMFIDYAHNAVSMENVLKTLKEYNPNRLIVLFGAGGNRPKIRRYEMGESAGKIADLSVITSDNPRFENPMEIIEDIKVGINKTKGKYVVIPDRIEAIKYCVQNAKSGDIIVLAGKGHEDYQEIRGVKYPMDERIIVKNILNNQLIK